MNQESRSRNGDVPSLGALTASFGVTAWQPGDMLETPLRGADRALYAAKSGGRNRVGMA